MYSDANPRFRQPGSAYLRRSFLADTTQSPGETGFPSCPFLPQPLPLSSNPLPVKAVLAFRRRGRAASVPLCPRCGCSLPQKYQSFCHNCAQRLDWSAIHSATIFLAPNLHYDADESL